MPSLVKWQSLTGSKRSKIQNSAKSFFNKCWVICGMVFGWGGLAGAFGRVFCLLFGGAVCLLLTEDWFPDLEREFILFPIYCSFLCKHCLTFQIYFQVFLCRLNTSNTQKFSLREAREKNKKNATKENLTSVRVSLCKYSCLFFLYCTELME